jgi:ParB family chromosome partitioning protein
VRQIPLDLLDPGPFQPRGAMDEAALAELADSIRARGILQPLLARPHPGNPSRFQIIAGERRWRAAARAGLHEAPVLVRDLTDPDALAAALVENLQREDLNALEEADGYNRLLEEFAMTQESLARAVGKSRSHISNMLRLLHLPPSVQAALRAGTVTAGHARALLSHPEPDQALDSVLARGLSVRETEALASARRAPAGLAPETSTIATSISSMGWSCGFAAPELDSIRQHQRPAAATT